MTWQTIWWRPKHFTQPSHPGRKWRPIWAILLLVRAGRGPDGRRAILLRSLLFVGAALLPIVLWSYRNLATHGLFTVSPINSTNLGRYHAPYTLAQAEGIKSVLVVPLMLEKKAIGVLRVYADRVRKFRDEEIKFLKAVANLSAIALDNARMHETLRIRCDLMAAHKYRIDDN